MNDFDRLARVLAVYPDPIEPQKLISLQRATAQLIGDIRFISHVAPRHLLALEQRSFVLPPTVANQKDLVAVVRLACLNATLREGLPLFAFKRGLGAYEVFHATVERDSAIDGLAKIYLEDKFLVTPDLLPDGLNELNGASLFFRRTDLERFSDRPPSVDESCVDSIAAEIASAHPDRRLTKDEVIDIASCAPYNLSASDAARVWRSKKFPSSWHRPGPKKSDRRSR